MAVEAGLFCVSGTALGSAIASLLVQLRPKRNGLEVDNFDRRRSWEWPSGYGRQAPWENKGDQIARGDRAASKQNARGPIISAMEGEEDIAIAAGFSMEEARQHSLAQGVKSKEKTPMQVLGDLQRGNARFWTGQASRPEATAFERRALIGQQFPSVAILGCADSRVPTEIVFDQGLGDMFVVRVAGNCLDTGTQASLQYAVVHLGVKVLVVMGHEGCGAIKAAGLPDEKIKQEPLELSRALSKLKEGLDVERLSNVFDAKAHDREAVVTNVQRQVEALTKDPCVMEKVRAKELIVVGAFYEISSGIVDFFLELTEAPDRKQTRADSGSVHLRRGSLTRGVSSRLEVTDDQ